MPHETPTAAAARPAPALPVEAEVARATLLNVLVGAWAASSTWWSCWRSGIAPGGRGRSP